MTNIRLAGVEHALQFTSTTPGLIHLRSYRILLRRASGGAGEGGANPRLPRVELDEIGPAIDLALRRSHLASDDLYKAACKQVGERERQEKDRSRDASRT